MVHKQLLLCILNIRLESRYDFSHIKSGQKILRSNLILFFLKTIELLLEERDAEELVLVLQVMER